MSISVPGNSALDAMVPLEVAVKVNKWRRLYVPGRAKIEPHVTVAYPPFVPQEDWRLVRPRVAECLEAFAPFAVTLAELGTFTGEPHVLWLKPEDGGHFSRIRSTLAGRLPQYFPATPWEYEPHVTIGLLDSQEALARAPQRVESEWRPLDFQVSELAYAVADEDGTYRTVDRLALGHAEASVT